MAPQVLRYDLKVPAILGLAALTVRVVALLRSFEIPGDGPYRAMLAYEWSVSPRFELYGVWPPGFNLLAGPFYWLVPDPLVSTRILNVLLGSLTIPLFYGLVRRIYGPWPALFSASVLVFLPLHIGLSATSLTEATFLFLVIAGMLLFLAGSVEQPYRRTLLVSAILLLSLAAMTRYEAWVLLPAFPLYYLVARRRLLPSVGTAVSLSVVPLAWTLSNYLHTGRALLGFTAGVWGAEGGPIPVTLISALYGLATKVAVHISWFLPLLACAGLLLQLARWLRHDFRPETMLHATVFGLYGLMMIVFTIARGPSLIWDRFLVFGFVIGLPYAALPLTRVANLRIRALAAVALLALSALLAPSVLLAPRIGRPQIYLTEQRPHDISELATWFQSSRYRNDSILLTRMDWKSTYFFLYAPKSFSRSLLFSFWVTDTELGEFIRRQNPLLLITAEGDDEYQRHVEPFLRRPIRSFEMVYTAGTIRVYDIGR